MTNITTYELVLLRVSICVGRLQATVKRNAVLVAFCTDMAAAGGVCVYACACVRACVCACVRACVCVGFCCLFRACFLRFVFRLIFLLSLCQKWVF
jgi:hypothetical protein